MSSICGNSVWWNDEVKAMVRKKEDAWNEVLVTS